MDTINKVKLDLTRFFRARVSKLEFAPVKIISKNDKYYLIFKNIKSPNKYVYAMSFDGFDFDVIDKPTNTKTINQVIKNNFVTGLEIGGKKFSYTGDRHVHLTTISADDKATTDKNHLIVSPNPTAPAGAFLYPKGVLVVYYEKIIRDSFTQYKIYLAEFDRKSPDHLLWRTSEPVWESSNQFETKEIVPLGAVAIKDKIIMYFYVDNKFIYGVFLSGFHFNPAAIKKTKVKLQKHEDNPIISPQSHNEWEAFTTLNPAAVYVDKKVRILYRAQGYDYISKVGYASSEDGVNIDYRSNKPIYGPTADFETNKTGSVNPNLMSAGGWGGVEDPRVTRIGDRLYMVYVAFDGWSNLRLAMTSISVDDFLKERWNWEKPVLVSPPNMIDKSGCLLPEKIKGKYVFFHRVFPNILIDYVDDLNFKNDNWLRGQYKIKIRPKKWDSRKIGAGAPPLRTKDGWLLIYYGVDDLDASKYHIGAMLLDLKKPEKVLYRSSAPILSPTEDYELNGFKPGIAYPCGAVIVKDELLVYYGAADSVVCVAQSNLNKFLKDLKNDVTPQLSLIQVKEVAY